MGAFPTEIGNKDDSEGDRQYAKISAPLPMTTRAIALSLVEELFFNKSSILPISKCFLLKDKGMFMAYVNIRYMYLHR